MGWNIRALGQVTEIAEIALVDNFPVICLVDAVDLERLRFVDQVEQGRESITQADTAATAVANVEDTLELFEECSGIVKTRIILTERMSGRRLQATLARFSCHLSSLDEIRIPKDPEFEED
jgi:hypothetical protein